MIRYRSVPFLLSLALAFVACGAAAPTGEIHRLLRDGKLAEAQALLAKDAKLVAARNDMDETPLHIAARYCPVTMVKYLLDRGAEVNARAYNKFTPLHLATDPEVVRLLIAHKADLEAKDSSGRSALQNAADTCAYRGSAADVPERKIVQLLLDAGAHYDIRSAACLADVDRVRALLKEDPRPARDKSLMCLAVIRGRASVVKLLLDFQGDPHSSYDGLPLLYFALPHPDVVRLLPKAGADPKVRLRYTGNGKGPPEEKKWTLLHCAAREGHVETAKLLLEAGLSVNIRTADGDTPLHWAARYGQPEMAKLLLENKATIEGDDGRRALAGAAAEIQPVREDRYRGENARYQAVITLLLDRDVPMDLFTAIALGKTARVKELLKEKPELAGSKDQEDYRHRPALHRAVDLGHKDIVTLLLDAGAPIDVRDEYAYTALHCAAFWGREGIARLLIERKADVNAKADNGLTPLYEASRLNNLAVARLLLAAGADVNSKDRDGATPLSQAGTPEMRKLLEAHGGKK